MWKQKLQVLTVFMIQVHVKINVSFTFWTSLIWIHNLYGSESFYLLLKVLHGHDFENDDSGIAVKILFRLRLIPLISISVRHRHHSVRQRQSWISPLVLSYAKVSKKKALPGGSQDLFSILSLLSLPGRSPPPSRNCLGLLV